MVMTSRGNVSGSGPTGIPGDPVNLDRGGPEGIGGRANTVDNPRSRDAEPAGTATAGAGQNSNLFDPFAGSGKDGPGAAPSATTKSGGGSNLDAPAPASQYSLTGTPATSGAGQGRVMRGGRSYR